MRFDSLSGLAALVSDTLKGLDLEARLKEQTCILVWDEVVGERVADAAQPEFIRDGRMFVVTKSPVWANELTLYKPDIIARLNKRVGGSALKEIVFKAGGLQRKKISPRDKRSNGPELEGIQLTDAELERVRSIAASSGEGSADVLCRLMEAALKLDKWKKAQGWRPCKECGVLQNSSAGVCPVCEMGRTSA
jgi:predicted nucleic acid-binding Zn ribbon protein